MFFSQLKILKKMLELNHFFGFCFLFHFLHGGQNLICIKMPKIKLEILVLKIRKLITLSAQRNKIQKLKGKKKIITKKQKHNLARRQ